MKDLKELGAMASIIVMVLVVLGMFASGFATILINHPLAGVVLLALFVASLAYLILIEEPCKEEEYANSEEVVSITPYVVAKHLFVEVHKKWKEKSGKTMVCEEPTFIKCENITRIDTDTIATRIYVNEDGGRFVHVAESPEQIFGQLNRAYANRSQTSCRADEKV